MVQILPPQPLKRPEILGISGLSFFPRIAVKPFLSEFCRTRPKKSEFVGRIQSSSAAAFNINSMQSFCVLVSSKSLSHYPDVFGLIASICNQFTNTSTFLDSGRGTITITNGTGNGLELYGATLLSKLYCGFINWIMHCISDVAGSSGSKGVGAGLPIPVTEFFQFCNFGRFENEKGQWQSFATVMTKVYEEGYDLRHGVATSIPVLLNDLLIHAIFTIKQHFYAGVPWERIKDNYDGLLRMKTVSIGSLCLVDLSEAAITSWGNSNMCIIH